MPSTLISIEVRSKWRARLVVDPPDASLASAPSEYALVRLDGAGSVVAVASAFAVDTGTYELSFTAPLLASPIAYALTHATGLTGTARVEWRPAPAPTTQPGARGVGPYRGDPEAEALGVDLDFMARAGLDANGDIPQLRGLASLRADLLAIAMTHPSELFHRPTEGAALDARVNGPGTAPELDALRGSARRQWSRDPRVGALVVTATDDPATGAATVHARVVPRAAPSVTAFVTLEVPPANG